MTLIYANEFMTRIDHFNAGHRASISTEAGGSGERNHSKRQSKTCDELDEGDDSGLGMQRNRSRELRSSRPKRPEDRDALPRFAPRTKKSGRDARAPTPPFPHQRSYRPKMIYVAAPAIENPSTGSEMVCEYALTTCQPASTSRAMACSMSAS